ncbi:hypothetical protein J437_LFUL001080 [Ladona fulva]|uniref:Uncharacterized protein n=1 Tax=Ladona fulva TaxID=123851 RepID=A0A8K0JX46_LADFU|nr:hypothetical protein J437_LFUL001080 [Ladona fulva]
MISIYYCCMLSKLFTYLLIALEESSDDEPLIISIPLSRAQVRAKLAQHAHLPLTPAKEEELKDTKTNSRLNNRTQGKNQEASTKREIRSREGTTLTSTPLAKNPPAGRDDTPTRRSVRQTGVKASARERASPPPKTRGGGGSVSSRAKESAEKALSEQEVNTRRKTRSSGSSVKLQPCRSQSCPQVKEEDFPRISDPSLLMARRHHLLICHLYGDMLACNHCHLLSG